MRKTMKHISIGTILSLIVAVGILAVSVEAKEVNNRVTVFHNEATPPTEVQQIIAAKCFVYETKGIRDENAIKVYRSRLGSNVPPSALLAMGYAAGQVDTAAYFMSQRGMPFDRAQLAAAKVYAKQLGCSPLQAAKEETTSEQYEKTIAGSGR